MIVLQIPIFSFSLMRIFAKKDHASFTEILVQQSKELIQYS